MPSTIVKEGGISMATCRKLGLVVAKYQGISLGTPSLSTARAKHKFAELGLSVRASLYSACHLREIHRVGIGKFPF